jgi:hypothetical protein
LSQLSRLYRLHRLLLCFRLFPWNQLGPLNPFGRSGLCFPYCRLDLWIQLHQ